MERKITLVVLMASILVFAGFSINEKAYAGAAISPVADAGPNQQESEGVTVSFDGSGSSPFPPATIVSFDWDFGDTTVGSGVTTTHVYADNGVHTVILTVTDSNGLTSAKIAIITIFNANPTLMLGPNIVANLGDTVNISPTFNDLGTLDTHIGFIDWGDGTPVDSGAATESPFGPPGSPVGADGTISGSHLYATPNTYTVTVTVDDDDGGTVSDTLSVTIADISIGGTNIPIDQTALLLAGVQSISMWMIPVVIAGIGIGVFVIKRRN